MKEFIDMFLPAPVIAALVIGAIVGFILGFAVAGSTAKRLRERGES